MNIILLGIQGAGKGTQAEMLSNHLKIPHIETGRLFRDEVAKNTPLGKKLHDVMTSGKLVSDAILFKIVKERLAKEDCESGALLDGIPRTLNQAEMLDSLFQIDFVIELRLDDTIALQRLSGRRVCEQCKTLYGLQIVPRKESICDKCGGRLVTRKDDTPDAIKKRIALYHDETEPLLEYYKPRGITYRVDASKRIEDVFEEILLILGFS